MAITKKTLIGKNASPKKTPMRNKAGLGSVAPSPKLNTAADSAPLGFGPHR